VTPSGRYETFIAANRSLWARIPAAPDPRGLLLVEPNHHPIISHANAVFARVVARAKSLRIGWIDTGNREIQERMRSYDPASRTVPMPWRSFIHSVLVGWRFIAIAGRLFATGRVLDISIDGVPFGDILYDSYLRQYQVATLNSVNTRLLQILWTLVRRHLAFRRLLQAHTPAAVLVSHDVGLSSGVLLRTALASGVPVYHQRGGVGTAALNRYLPDAGRPQYAYRPRDQDMARLAHVDRAHVESDFRSLMRARIQEHSDKDARNAYREGKTVFQSRREFADAWGFPADRPCVFIMLHVFNDHPHSHFGSMLFKDYYDWFVQTLAYARTHSRVNWVFKEHPSAALYPTRDIVLSAHFTDLPPHVVFLAADASFSSESIVHVADALVTVAGTAGVEFAAYGGIPNVLAGRAMYSGFGFTIEPNTVAEYFQTLDRIDTLPRLTADQAAAAQVVFLYAERYSSVRYSWSPPVSLEEEHEPDLDARYWEGVVNLYARAADRLLAEFEAYVACVRPGDFSRLSALDYPDLSVRGGETSHC